MEILDARNLTIQKAFELEKYGILLTQFPVKCDDSDTEYSELPIALWCNLNFIVKGSDQPIKQILEEAVSRI